MWRSVPFLRSSSTSYPRRTQYRWAAVYAACSSELGFDLCVIGIT